MTYVSAPAHVWDIPGGAFVLQKILHDSNSDQWYQCWKPTLSETRTGHTNDIKKTRTGHTNDIKQWYQNTDRALFQHYQAFQTHGPTTPMISNNDIKTRTGHNNDIKQWYQNTDRAHQHYQRKQQKVNDINNDNVGRSMISTKIEQWYQIHGPGTFSILSSKNNHIIKYTV